MLSCELRAFEIGMLIVIISGPFARDIKRDAKSKALLATACSKTRVCATHSSLALSDKMAYLVKEAKRERQEHESIRSDLEVKWHQATEALLEREREMVEIRAAAAAARERGAEAEKLVDAQEKMATLTVANTELQADIAHLHESKTKLEKTVSETEEQVKRLEGRNAALVEAGKEQHNAFALLEENNEQLRKSVRDAREKARDLENRLQQQEERFTRLQTINRHLKHGQQSCSDLCEAVADQMTSLLMSIDGKMHSALVQVQSLAAAGQHGPKVAYTQPNLSGLPFPPVLHGANKGRVRLGTSSAPGPPASALSPLLPDPGRESADQNRVDRVEQARESEREGGEVTKSAGGIASIIQRLGQASSFKLRKAPSFSDSPQPPQPDARSAAGSQARSELEEKLKARLQKEQEREEDREEAGRDPGRPVVGNLRLEEASANDSTISVDSVSSANTTGRSQVFAANPRDEYNVVGELISASPAARGRGTLTNAGAGVVVSSSLCLYGSQTRVQEDQPFILRETAFKTPEQLRSLFYASPSPVASPEDPEGRSCDVGTPGMAGQYDGDRSRAISYGSSRPTSAASSSMWNFELSGGTMHALEQLQEDLRGLVVDMQEFVEEATIQKTDHSKAEKDKERYERDAARESSLRNRERLLEQREADLKLNQELSKKIAEKAQAQSQQLAEQVEALTCKLSQIEDLGISYEFHLKAAEESLAELEELHQTTLYPLIHQRTASRPQPEIRSALKRRVSFSNLLQSRVYTTTPGSRNSDTEIVLPCSAESGGGDGTEQQDEDASRLSLDKLKALNSELETDKRRMQQELANSSRVIASLEAQMSILFAKKRHSADQEQLDDSEEDSDDEVSEQVDRGLTPSATSKKRAAAHQIAPTPLTSLSRRKSPRQTTMYNIDSEEGQDAGHAGDERAALASKDGEIEELKKQVAGHLKRQGGFDELESSLRKQITGLELSRDYARWVSGEDAGASGVVYARACGGQRGEGGLGRA